jgi:Tfp pilus assembly protein PilX
MASPTTPANGPGSRTLIVVLLVVAVILALLPLVIARTHRVQTMRADLAEVLDQCRARYAAASTAADTAAADAWQPALHGDRNPGDPGCGPYRRRNMLGAPRR